MDTQPGTEEFDWNSFWEALAAQPCAAEPEYYTGVGARKSPEWACQLLTRAARFLAARGWWARSGAAVGADSAIEAGAGANKQIFLPKKGFNGSKSRFWEATQAAYRLAEAAHGAWSACNDFARRAHARNAHEVLGPDLDVPSKFVLCYTEDGVRTERDSGKATGGTRTAIVLAERNGIPVMNIGYPPHAQLLREFLDRHLKDETEPASPAAQNGPAAVPVVAGVAQPGRRSGFSNLRPK